MPSNIIQWFPGHMAKARREIKEKVNLVDVIIELRDARIPYSSKNPMVDEIVGNKPRLIILNKASMADKQVTKAWIKYLSHDNSLALDVDSINNYNMNKILPSLKEVLKEKITRDQSRGIMFSGIRAIVLGIPNVGKSTFINTISKRKATKTGDKPGVTKTQTWIKISPELQLLDTPGILWPKFEDPSVGLKLSICGSIKDEIVNIDDIGMGAIKYLKELYPNLLMNRYGLTKEDLEVEDEISIIEKIGYNRKALLRGNQIDYERVFTIILNDIRSFRIGAISFEQPSD